MANSPSKHGESACDGSCGGCKSRQQEAAGPRETGATPEAGACRSWNFLEQAPGDTVPDANEVTKLED